MVVVLFTLLMSFSRRKSSTSRNLALLFSFFLASPHCALATEWLAWLVVFLYGPQP